MSTNSPHLPAAVVILFRLELLLFKQGVDQWKEKLIYRCGYMQINYVIMALGALTTRSPGRESLDADLLSVHHDIGPLSSQILHNAAEGEEVYQ